jgi:hypothetical protein
MDKSKKVVPEAIRWTLEVDVARLWVEDGYFITEDSIQQAMAKALAELFPGAYKNEVVVKLIKGPPPQLLKAIQKH